MYHDVLYGHVAQNKENKDGDLNGGWRVVVTADCGNGVAGREKFKLQASRVVLPTPD